MQFFKYQIKCNIGENFIAGIYPLNSLLSKYIEKYILCQNCENPETRYSLHKKYVKKKCKACGHNEIIHNDDKLINFVIKHNS